MQLYGLEIPLIHTIVQEPRLLKAFLSHQTIVIPDRVERSIGAPDLGDGDHPGVNMGHPSAGREAIQGNKWFLNPYTFFGFAYNGDGMIVPSVKIKNDKTDELDMTVENYLDSVDSIPISEDCNILVPPGSTVTNVEEFLEEDDEIKDHV